MNEIQCVPSGYPSLDLKINGWHPSELIIIASGPSVGKTAFSMNIARNAVMDYHIPVAYFSLEMSSDQFVKRLITTNANIIRGDSELEYKLVQFYNIPLYLDDTMPLELTEFCTKVKNLVQNQKVKLIIVDYLQLMRGPANINSTREQEIATIIQTLKSTAEECNVPIIVLSQFKYRIHSDCYPKLNDLPAEKAINQYADTIIFIHRIGDNPEEAKIIVAKHYNIKPFNIEMKYISNQLEFME